MDVASLTYSKGLCTIRDVPMLVLDTGIRMCGVGTIIVVEEILCMGFLIGLVFYFLFFVMLKSLSRRVVFIYVYNVFQFSSHASFFFGGLGN